MNSYEQMKNQFLVELNKVIPMSADNLNLVASALDVAACKYDVELKEAPQQSDDNIVPAMLNTYLIVKKTEGSSRCCFPR